MGLEFRFELRKWLQRGDAISEAYRLIYRILLKLVERT